MSTTINTREISLQTADGSTTTALVTEPNHPGPHPAIVFGAEAMGMNKFTRDTAIRMSENGYVTITQDYYRGSGPSQPDNYEDFTEVFAAIENLDFPAATRDLLAALDWIRALPTVSSDRIAVWGYCTGGTLAMLAGCLDRTWAATVLFFPSQPRFEELTTKRPSHPMELMWNIPCPVMVIYGDEDYLMPPPLLEQLRANLVKWNIEHEIIVYPGAKHAFTAPSPEMHHAAATADSWKAANAFLAKHLAPKSSPT